MQTWGFSSRSLAASAGCSKSLVANLASGTRDGTGEYAATRLARELRVPVSTLFVMPDVSTISGQNEGLVDAAWVSMKLRKSQPWVREQAATGTLPSSRIGRQLRFRPADIEAYIDAARSGDTYRVESRGVAS